MCLCLCNACNAKAIQIGVSVLKHSRLSIQRRMQWWGQKCEKAHINVHQDGRRDETLIAEIIKMTNRRAVSSEARDLENLAVASLSVFTR